MEKEILTDFEELIKLKKFHLEEKREPYECTYEKIARSLNSEYIDNIESKLVRWVNISHVLFFENVLPVKYYFEAKMLFRDGFYEAVITLSRSICEMICYDMLKEAIHPFGEYKDLEMENFRTLAKYLAIPKEITKVNFEQNILKGVTAVSEQNFLKSSYQLNTKKAKYNFKIENGRTAKNLNRLFSIFEEVAFRDFDNFPNNSYTVINRVYDEGNTYVHARKSANSAQDDATSCLNGICEVLIEIYGVEELPINQIIKSGYSDFPDICTGMNFAIDIFLTPDDAMRGYLNLPSQKQIEKLLSVQGDWDGEWQSDKTTNLKGKLTFFLEGEYLKANLIYVNKNRKTQVVEPLEIKLFGEYFKVKGFNPLDLKHQDEKHVHFELCFFNDEILLGKNLINKGNVLFKRVR
jgi:hypothetical protein